MNHSSSYQTKNKKHILDFIMTQGSTHFSANDVYRHFVGCDLSISMPTIYRQLDKMVDDGILKKYRTAESESALYYHIGKPTEPLEQPLMKCTSCGKIIPLHCRAIQPLLEHIEDEHHFLVQMNETVLYGKCETCFHNTLDI